MLVGEYGVVTGGSALTIPFHRFHAQVRSTTSIPRGKEKEVSESISYLKRIYQYIDDLPKGNFHAGADMELFYSKLENYWLELNIPVGYGLGSSGAVSAAIYDLFFPECRTLPLSSQKEDLAAIESFFHGKSSGVDALTCFIGKPLYFTPDGTIQITAFNPLEIRGGYRFFLLDSGMQFKTGPLVEYYLKQMEESGFASSIRSEYLVINQKLIETLLGEREADPGLLMRVLADYQYTHFRKMIPENMLDLWIEGQVSSEYHLKLNGSGGGFMLGITHCNLMESLEKRWKPNLIWIE